MKKSNTPLINGIILAAVSIYLSYYFSAHGMWNPASVIVVLLLVLLSVGQIIIWKMYFREPKKTKPGKKK